MNFSYAALATLQEANGKNHINGIENFLAAISSCYCFLKSYKRSEVEFRYNNSKDTKTFYHILLKMIRGLVSSKTKSQLKIRLSLIEPKINILQILAKKAKR